MGRPGMPEPDMVVNVKLVLRSPEDDDLITLFRRTYGQSYASVIKAAMRSGIVDGLDLGADVDEDDMDDAFGNLIL